MSRIKLRSVEFGFSLAKSALKTYPSLREIRDFRNRVRNHTKYINNEELIILRFPQELVITYLDRSKLPYKTIKNCRKYKSTRGQLLYDRIDFGDKGCKITLFVPHSHNDIPSYESNIEIEVPSFVDLWENYWKDTDKPESFTTLLHIDSKGMIVTKAYLDQRLTEALQSTVVLPSQIKTGREAAMLQILQELEIQVPKILGFNADKTAFAMDLISGKPLLDWMQVNRLTDKDIDNIANLVINTQKKLDSKKDVIAESFPPYPAHTGNVTLLLKETIERVSDHLWAPQLQGEMRTKFKKLAQVLSDRFSENPEYYTADDAIYGDFAVNNIMRGERGNLTLIDPIISIGRRSMDLGRLGRSIIARNIEAFQKYFPKILSKYNEMSNSPVSSTEITDMLCVDLLRILSLLLKIPDDQLSRFPSYIQKISRDKLGLYVDDIIPRLLENGI